MNMQCYTQGCENSQSCRTLSDKSSECPVKRNWTVYKVYGEQDKSSKIRPKCPAVGSMFPHPWLYLNCVSGLLQAEPIRLLVVTYMYIYIHVYKYKIKSWTFSWWCENEAAKKNVFPIKIQYWVVLDISVPHTDSEE